MKKYVPMMIAVLSCIISAVCLVRINELNNGIRDLQWRIDEKLTNTQNAVRNITNEIENTLEQQTNLLCDSGWEYSDITAENIEENQVMVKCYVIPKEYSSQNTKGYIYCNDIPYSMTLENGRYVADITMPFFTESIVDKVQFEQNGTISTQKIDWYFDIKQEVLPAFYAYTHGYSISYKDNYAEFSYNGAIDIQIEHKGNKYDKQAVFVTVVDGKKVQENQILLNNPQHSDEYIDVYWIEDVDGKINVDYGSEMEVYMEFKDANGLVYRYTMDRLVLNKNGEKSETTAVMDGCDIYKADGTPLFVTER